MTDDKIALRELLEKSSDATRPGVPRKSIARTTAPISYKASHVATSV